MRWSNPKLNVDFRIENVLFVPELGQNLLSVHTIAHKGINVLFTDDQCEFRKIDTQKLCSTARVHKGCSQYELGGFVVKNQEVSIAEITSDLELWHQRLGHVNQETIKTMSSKDIIKDLHVEKDSKIDFCESCTLGKQTREQFPKTGGTRAEELLEIIHSDVCGPMPVRSLGGNRYFVTFIDDLSRYGAVYFIKEKNQVLSCFKEYVSMVERQTGQKVKTLRSDNGTEYVNKDFDFFLKNTGIKRQLTVPYTPEQNGVAERKNRTLMESARSMMHFANLTQEFWAEAVLASMYVQNRCTTKAVEGVVPFEAFFGKKPSVKDFKVFGCDAYVHVPTEKRKKLDMKSVRHIFLGYSGTQKGYRLFEPKSKRFTVSRDVKFVENSFGGCLKKVNTYLNDKSEMISEQSGNRIEEIESSDISADVRHDNADVNEESEISERIEPRRSLRERKAPSMYGDWLDGEELEQELLCAELENIGEPNSLSEAIESSQSAQWKQAVKYEYEALMKNATWTLEKLPEGRKAIGNKWIFKIKHNADGTINRYKARLVAQGFSQKPGIDYKETYSPVARFTSIRTVLAIANELDLHLHQMDVQTAFLNGDLQEEIYMCQPEGFVVEGKEDYVCKLKKGLYGLKQASRCWFYTMDVLLRKIGFTQCDGDSCIYLKRENTKFVMLALYVDDLLLASNDGKMLRCVKLELMKHLKMKDLGEATFCLGIEIMRDRKNRKMKLSQKGYLENLLKRFGMEDCRPVSTPEDPGLKLYPNTDDEVDKKLYQAAVGAITYITCGTRPDLASALASVNQFSSNPGADHWKALKHIFRYIKGTINYGLTYYGSEQKGIKLTGYVDADWGRNFNRKSQSGYLFFIQNSLVSWASKRQTVVALSTTEAEYVAAACGAQEAIWLRLLLKSIGFTQEEPTTLYEDNNGCIAISKDARYHSKTKHIDIKYHFIRDAVVKRNVELKYCTSKDMRADILTKPLPKSSFEHLRDLMNVKDVA